MENKQSSAKALKLQNHKGRVFFLTPRDSAFLHFIWRWKLASTATLHEAVGRPNSPYSTYKALERLDQHGYIESVRSAQHGFHAWQLSDLGFESIRESLGELNEEGYLSANLWHDRNVLAFQLGEWSSYCIPDVHHFTEQEMRRRPVDYYPSWVPALQDHRADGYTRIATGRKPWVLAYEVELWAKSASRYESVIRFYRMFRSLDRVYWLIGDPLVKDQILKAKACTQDESDNFHLFVDLVEYQAKGWDAQVKNERSETLFTLRENMRGMLGDPYGDYLGIARGQSRVTVHYDPCKVLGKSRGSR